MTFTLSNDAIVTLIGLGMASPLKDTPPPPIMIEKRSSWVKVYGVGGAVLPLRNIADGDRTRTLVIDYHHAMGGDVAIGDLEGGRDGAIGKEAFAAP